MKIRYYLVLVILFLSMGISTTAMLFNEIFFTQKKIEEYVATWDVELTSSIVSRDTFQQRRYGKSLALITGYNVLVTSKVTTSQLQFNSGSCLISDVKQINLSNFPVGSIETCITLRSLIKNMVGSPVFLISMLILFLTSLSAYIVPFIHHKNSFIKAIDYLESKNDSTRATRVYSKDDHIMSRIVAIFERLASSEKETIAKNAENRRLESLHLFAKQVAHDIRAPLSALDAVIFRIGRDAILDENSSELLPILKASSERIKNIAIELLEYGKERKTQILNVLEKFEIQSVTDKIIKEKRIHFDKIHIDLNFRNEGETLFVVGNEVHYGRMISNLLNNSKEAFPAGKGKILLDIEKIENQVCIKILDDGIGMSSEVLNQINNKPVSFGKSDSIDSGYGLGLSYAVKLAKMWGGHLVVDSELGRGTTVTIFLNCWVSPRGVEISI